MTSRDRHHLKPLLQRALAGDVRAWNDFFREIRRYLHAEVHRAAGPDDRGPLDHSLIVQSTLRRVWEHIDEQFAGGGEECALARFLAWVKVIVRNRTAEEQRKLRRRRTAAAGSAIEAVADARPGPDPGRPGVGKRDRVAVELAAALARLPEKKRQVVELFWFERLSDAAIGERLGCSAGAVKVLRCRALRELRSPGLLTLLEEEP
jgi:RNA polymerase sigma factor (sigma-70 family)